MIGQIYHLNGLRLNTSMDSPERALTQNDLVQALQQMATRCACEVANHELFPPAAKVLESMTVHWSGLTVFVNSPWVDMDNNTAERDIRGPVVGRKNFYGSGSERSAELAATMYSTLATTDHEALGPERAHLAFTIFAGLRGQWQSAARGPQRLSSMADGCQASGRHASVPPSVRMLHPELNRISPACLCRIR